MLVSTVTGGIERVKVSNDIKAFFCAMMSCLFRPYAEETSARAVRFFHTTVMREFNSFKVVRLGFVEPIFDLLMKGGMIGFECQDACQLFWHELSEQSQSECPSHR